MAVFHSRVLGVAVGVGVGIANEQYGKLLEALKLKLL